MLLEGVVPGAYDVSVTCKHYVPRIPYRDLIVKDSDVDDVTWQVSPGARIAGRVRSQTGAPIDGATINLISSNGVSFASAYTGEDGTFAADGLVPGKTEVVASASGFVKPTTRTFADVTMAVGRVRRARARAGAGRHDRRRGRR